MLFRAGCVTYEKCMSNGYLILPSFLFQNIAESGILRPFKKYFTTGQHKNVGVLYEYSKNKKLSISKTRSFKLNSLLADLLWNCPYKIFHTTLELLFVSRISYTQAVLLTFSHCGKSLSCLQAVSASRTGQIFLANVTKN